MIEDISFGREISLGAFAGLLFIVLNAVFGIAIGIPLLAFSSETEKYAVVSGVAPLVEEGIFRSFLPFVLGVIGLPLWLIAIATIAGFTFFHLAAYGGSVAAASSLFIGAALFATAAFFMTYWQSDASDFQVPLAAIIAHALINTWLIVKATGLVVVGV